MCGEYKLYSRIEDGETLLELWGGSTKHPDSIFYFSDFNKTDWIDYQNQIFQWILECASKLTLPVHAYYLAEWAMEGYKTQRGLK